MASFLQEVYVLRKPPEYAIIKPLLITDTDKVLQALARLETGQKALQADVKSLKEGQETLELKVETFHAEQTKANTHILTMLTEMNEINAKAIDTRVTRIENTSISRR